jgi:hypothetical protein
MSVQYRIYEPKNVNFFYWFLFICGKNSTGTC